MYLKMNGRATIAKHRSHFTNENFVFLIRSRTLLAVNKKANRTMKALKNIDG
jgi:hypothetical protein